MASPVLTGNQFNQALPDSQVRVIQIIHLALGAGVLVFSAIIVVLHTLTEVAQPEPGSDGMLRNLTMASTGFFLVALPASQLIYESLFRKKLDLQSSSGEMDVDRVMGKIRTAFIVRSAILEAASFLSCSGVGGTKGPGLPGSGRFSSCPWSSLPAESLTPSPYA